MPHPSLDRRGAASPGGCGGGWVHVARCCSASTGATAVDGAVAQVDVTGLLATAFDHFDSVDPHLHIHVVISNKVQTAFDGKLLSLDGRPMHTAVVALSEQHEAVFADHMARTFGVEWEERGMVAFSLNHH